MEEKDGAHDADGQLFLAREGGQEQGLTRADIHEALLRRVKDGEGSAADLDEYTCMTEEAESLHTFATLTLQDFYAGLRATEVEEGSKLKFSVERLQISPLLAHAYMHRRFDDAYSAALGVSYELQLFPPQLKDGGRYRADTVRLARYSMSVRIRRLLLLDELGTVDDKLQAYR